MDYYLYNPHSYVFRAKIKKLLKKSNLDYKNTSWQKVWVDMIRRRPDAALDLASPVLIMENRFLKDPQCYLPETSSLIDQILDTNYEGLISTLPPCKLFSLAIPKANKFNNEIIKGIFVQYLTNNEFKNEYLSSFNKEFDCALDIPLVGSNINKDQPLICISYNDKNNESLIVIVSTLSNYSSVLSAKTFEEYLDMQSTWNKEVFSHGLSHSESRTQFEVIKFVLGFMVYMTAHPDCLLDTKCIKMTGSDKDSRPIRINTIKHFKPVGKVRPHYRNLRDERYYRNQWTDWPQGSRWISVNMNTTMVTEE